MTLVDAGPLIALLDAGDPDHAVCRAVLPTLKGPLLTTWPVLTEAMHFLGKQHGARGRKALWKLVLDGKLQIVEPIGNACERMAALMEKYHDVPMDLADASLVALAEVMGTNRVFSLDGDFEVYRLKGRTPFELIPKLAPEHPAR